MWRPAWRILQEIPEEDSSSSLFSSLFRLYFQRYSNMPCFPAVQIEYNLREELIPYEYPLKSSKGVSLHLNLIQGRACTQKMGDSRAGQSPWWSRGRLAVEGGRWGLAFTVHPWGHVLFLGQHNLDCCFLLHCTASRHDSAAPHPETL